MRTSYDYVEENPLAKKHPGYRGEALLIDEEEEQILLSELIINEDKITQFNTIIETLLPDRESLPDSFIWTILNIIDSPIKGIKSIIDNLYTSEQARRKMIRILSIPDLIQLPEEEFKKIMPWMENHPKEAWRWTIGLKKVHYDHNWNEIPIKEGLDSLWNDLDLPYYDFVHKYIKQTPEVWEEIYERVPRSSKLLGVDPEVAAHMSLKAYLRIIRSSEMQELSEEDREHGAIGLAMTFGHAWNKWLDVMKERGVNAHDATFWLSHERSPGLAKFLLKHRNAAIDDLEVISKAWNELEPDKRKGKLSDIIGYIIGRQFKNAKIPEMAVIAARCGVEEDHYYDIEQHWIDTLKESDNIPTIKITSDNLVMYKLAPDDIRDIWLGCPQFVTCCQSPGDAAESCAWYGHMANDSAFYVIEDRATGRMISESWVWRQQNTVVFDSIESAFLESPKRAAIINLYNKLSEKMIRNHGIEETRVGGKYKEWRKPEEDELVLIPLPLSYVLGGLVGDDYSDADVIQSIIATKEEKSKFDDKTFLKAFTELLRGAFIEEEYSLNVERIGEYINEFDIPWDVKTRIILYSETIYEGVIREAATGTLIIGGEEIASWTEWSEGYFMGDPDEPVWVSGDDEATIEAPHDIVSLLETIGYEPQFAVSKPSVTAFDTKAEGGRWGVQYRDIRYGAIVIAYNTEDDAELAKDEFEEWFPTVSFTLVKAKEDIEDPDRYDPDDWEEIE